ncbi:hypothetical protein KL86DYS1_11633 [uncultured Dysgonomonas sp.]|uniref:Uncharacterized protein n=1 Tax=uncultured Dysgonomonas sp. TaxID=206096 RepID=A0A212JAA3_9BACT|nr:hypothetical protein KL86DYS1_11633 [uncultured Dysgonomonas sp.]
MILIYVSLLRLGVQNFSSIANDEISTDNKDIIKYYVCGFLYIG